MLTFFISAFIVAIIWGITKGLIQRKELNEILEEHNIKSDFRFFGKYLGGYPAIVVNSPKDCYLILNDRKLHLKIDNYLVNIELNRIQNATLETKESLSAAKMALIGVFALAFKNKTAYLQVSFKNKIGEISNMVFEIPAAGEIAQLIMKNRYELIESQQKEQNIVSISP